MKKKLALSVLVLVFTLSLVPIGGAAVNNPKGFEQCHDKNGERIASKDCDPFACGCLFHEVFDYIKEFFD